MDATTSRSVTVRVHTAWLWLAGIGCTAIGFGAGFAVAPLVDWLVGLTGGAPGPLRLAALLPTEWAIPVLTVVGAAAGAWVVTAWLKDSPVVTVDGDRIVVRQSGSGVHLSREQINGVFRDGAELVVLDHGSGELIRTKAGDLSTDRLRAAIEGFGYVWLGTTDPREAEFVTWVDRSPDLDEKAHALFRARKRAMADKRPGAAEEALDGLRALGIAVRDRGQEQQYRRAG